MGDAPQVVKIACPGCETQFRLKPKKGRLPKGPLPCPKCAEEIPVVEENLRRKEGHAKTKERQAETKKTKAPGADVVKRGGSEKAPPDRRKKAQVGSEDEESPEEGPDGDEDEFDHLDAAASSSDEERPKSTFLGMGTSLDAVGQPTKKQKHDKTAVVDPDTLDKIREESSAAEDEPADSDADDDAGARSDRALTETAEADAFSRETAENPAATSDQPKSASGDDDAAESNKSKTSAKLDGNTTRPGAKVLGKVELKKKLKRSLPSTSKIKKESVPQTEGGERKRPEPTFKHSKETSEKPSLSTLLERARNRGGDLEVSPTGERGASQKPGSAEDLDRELDQLADETARALDTDSEPWKALDDDREDKPAEAPPSRPQKKPAEPVDDSVQRGSSEPPEYETGDSQMIKMLRRRVAEGQQPGAASERRGSGYIRLPTAEIQDVLGQGNYRLRVEDIVYEPVDKDGLTKLIKRGVLLGAEEIADADGDWMPITEHPVFQELRRKMAREAHDLLAGYSKPEPGRREEEASPASGKAGPPERREDAKPPPPSQLRSPEEAGVDRESGPAEPPTAVPIEEAPAETASAGEAVKEHSQPPPSPPSPTDVSHSEESDGEALEPSEAAVSGDESRPPVADLDQEIPEPDEELADPEADSSRSALRTWLPIGVAVVVLGAIVALALSPAGSSYLEEMMADDARGEADEDSTGPDEDEQRDDTDQTLAEAVDEASATVGEATDIDPHQPQIQESASDALLEAGEYAKAGPILYAMWREESSDAELSARAAEVLIDGRHFARAREVARAGLVLDDDQYDFERLFERAVTADPDLGDYAPVDLTFEEHADAIAPTDSGAGLAIDLERDGERTYRFLPSTSGSENTWRAAIASWRLCEMIACEFSVPHSQPARMARSTFEQLREGLDDADRERLSSLNFVEQDGGDYVYGALQQPIEDSARWPIEHIGLWRPWLRADSSLDLEETSATEAHAPLGDRSEEMYEAVVDQLDGQIELSHIAAQVSGVLVFDFLTNNWDRFAGDEDDWGESLRLADGELVSAINETAFNPRVSTRVTGRFRWTERFSERTVASLDALTREMVFEQLFPDPTAGERARIEVVWSQRDEALQRVDELISAHGRQAVLAFR